ncbi:DNA replication initiation complex subunit [Pyrobaculum sp.]|uniref:DNA replication complex subunit Gins51 n=1 Tax=Pyrobaculum sp. TaxID=2004705 RepID=UPI0031828AD2
MIEKLRLWLLAELNSRVLSDPPFSSYAEVAERFAKELQSVSLPQGLHEEVKSQVMSTVLTIMELRLRKIVWELSRGRVPTNVTAEEDRLIRPLAKIKQAGPQAKRAQDYVVVQFLTRHPAIVTEDFIQVGPFDKGDLAKLPLRDAKDLEERGVARRFLADKI